MVTVLIVDDQPVVRQGFAIFLGNYPGIRVVGEAESGHSAVAQVGRLHPDVVLMDVRMPGGDGIAATREVLSLSCPPRVLIVTTFDLDEYLFTAIEAGASGFLLKDSNPDELADAITTVAAGGVVISPRIIPRLTAEFARRRAPAAPAQHNLTARELDTAALVAEGMSNRAIAAKLALEPSTVKTHIANITKKIGADNRVQLAVWAHKNHITPLEGA